MEMDWTRRCAACVAAMTAALFAAALALARAWLTRLSGWGDAALLAGAFALLYGGMLALYARAAKPAVERLAFAGAFLALAMLARLSLLDYVTGDYDLFLSQWVRVFREKGAAALAESVGDYNLLYQYLLLLIARLPMSDLYLIKLFTVGFDCALALVMSATAALLCGERARTGALLAAFALPTAVLGGACWGQCDSVYVFFVILSLYWLKTGKGARSACALAVAFAFKLQTIFFFPVVLLALIHREYKPRHALCFLAAYLLTLLPALCAGRSLGSALAIYVNQSVGQYGERLSFNAPNLYLFFPMLELSSSQEFTWMRYIAGVDQSATNPYLSEYLMGGLQSAALAACALLTVLVVCYWLAHAREITPDMTLTFALFWAVFLPFVMPKIHDRYFFMADMLGVLYAARRRDRRFVPVLIVGASALSYLAFLTRQRPVDERWLALMMLLALLAVGRDLLGEMRAQRARLQRGGEAA